MKIIKSSYEILTPIDRVQILKHIELCGRVCYKSEDNITDDEESASKFVSMIQNRNHESVLEHFVISVRFICNRGFTHELVRHRIASFSQESTRYVRYASKPEFKTYSDEEVIDLYELGMSMLKISKLSKGRFTEWDVYKILDKNSIERRNLGNTGIVNHDYFEHIDTSEKAYLLGMIQADGNIRNTDITKSLTITQKDGFFLERILIDHIKENLSKSKDGSCYQYQIGSKKIVSDLIKKGIIPNKTYDMTEQNAYNLWDSIPVEYKYDFLRGLLDGDGSIRFFKQKNPGETESCNISYSGNKHLITIISNFIKSELNYLTNVKQVHGTRCLYRIMITNPSIGKQLCQRMYKNFVFPYGHPVKTSRAFEAINKSFSINDIADKYKVPNSFSVVMPPFMTTLTASNWIWLSAMLFSEKSYTNMIHIGATPQEARGVLPIDLKTEIVITANLREWKHIFSLRNAPAAHPSMRELMEPLNNEFKEKLPEIFG